MSTSNIDIIWITICSFLVFLMQAGFLCLEAGFTRNKNNINVAIKNVTDFSIATLVFWAFGFAIMFGRTRFGLVGSTDYFPDLSTSSDTPYIAFFIFQVMFCTTAVTIVSGAVAERLRFSAYMIITLIIALLIYPLFGHWVWNGIDIGSRTGWLGQRGFYDFAGSSVVHSIGGWAALAILLIIGPRTGRYDENGKPRNITASNIPLSTLGVFLLLLGWFGFNGGSLFGWSGDVLSVIANTVIAAISGLLSALVVSWMTRRNPNIELMLNGMLAGLVAVTASANAIEMSGAAIIGAIGGIVMAGCTSLMHRFKIDDAVGAIPVHLAAGIWGTLAVAFFADPSITRTGLSMGEQFLVQLLGVGVAAIWGCGACWLIFYVANRITPLRVSLEAEEVGLNFSEHGVTNNLFDLISVMEAQSRTGDLTLRAPVDTYSDTGRIAKSYNLVMDRLETAVGQSQMIVDGALDGIITFADSDFQLIVINPAAEAMFGYEAHELAGQSILKVFKDITLRSYKAVLRRIDRFGVPYELVGLKKNGNTFPAEIMVSRTEFGEDSLYICTIRDVSESKESQTQLKKMNMELVRTSRYKDEFMAAMSHELRTPLNAIMGSAQLMSEEVYGPLNDKQFNASKAIEHSGNNLLSLIDGILDLSKISSDDGQLEMAMVDVVAICDGAIKAVSADSKRKNLIVSTNYDPQVHTILANDGRLRQILVNLLNNAIKFTAEGGKIGLAVVGAPETNSAHFIVMDTGIGIPEEAFGILFKPFVQLDGRLARNFEGTGLGLALVDRLVKMHSGYVTVKSEVGKGSRFIVTLPWAHSQNGDAPVPSPHNRGQANGTYFDAPMPETELQPNVAEAEQLDNVILPPPIIPDVSEFLPHDFGDSVTEPEVQQPMVDRVTIPPNSVTKAEAPMILLAEDNEANAMMMTDYLTAKGFDLTVASTGIEAISLSASLVPAIILMDMQMPELSGLEAIRQIRSNRKLKDIPIIALTALTMPGDREKCIEAGASEYLSKPVSLRRLLEMIHKQLEPTE